MAFDAGKPGRVGGIVKVDYNGTYTSLFTAATFAGTGKLTQTLQTIAARTGLNDYMVVRRYRFSIYYTTSTNVGFDSLSILFRFFKTSGTDYIDQAFSIKKPAGGESFSFNEQWHTDFLVGVLRDPTDQWSLVADISVIAGTGAAVANMRVDGYYHDLPLMVEDAFSSSPASSTVVSPYTDVSDIELDKAHFFVWADRGSIETPIRDISFSSGSHGYDQATFNPGTRQKAGDYGLTYQHPTVINSTGVSVRTVAQKTHPVVLTLQPDKNMNMHYLSPSVATQTVESSGAEISAVGVATTMLFYPNQAQDGYWDGMQLDQQPSAQGWFQYKETPISIPSAVVGTAPLHFHTGNYWCGQKPDNQPAFWSIAVASNDFADIAQRVMIVGGLETSPVGSVTTSIQPEPYGHTTVESIAKCGLMYLNFGFNSFAAVNPDSPSLVLFQPVYDYTHMDQPYANFGEVVTDIQANLFQYKPADLSYLHPEEWSVDSLLAYFADPPFAPFLFQSQIWQTVSSLQLIGEDAAYPITNITDKVESGKSVVIYNASKPEEAVVSDSYIGTAVDKVKSFLSFAAIATTAGSAVVQTVTAIRYAQWFRAVVDGQTLPGPFRVRRSLTSFNKTEEAFNNLKL